MLEPAKRAATDLGLWLPIGADYFKVLQAPVVRGREFTDFDTLSTTPVALVNETMAKQFWPSEDPIGQTISIDFYNDQPRQIVGIVPDIRPSLRDREPAPQLYVPHTQLPTIQAGVTAFGLEDVTFVVRSSGRVDDWLPGARAAAKHVDPAHAVNNVQLLSAFAAQQTQGFRQYVILLGVFSGIALLLAVVGVYGVMSHSVMQRTNEIGIRVAFGATARNVLASVLGRGLAVIGTGIAIGLAAWAAALLGGIVTTVIGYVLLNVGLASFRPRDLKPRQTIETLKEDARWLRTQTR